MTTKEYNGWTNYETWLVNLWIGNDEGSHAQWGTLAQEAYDHSRVSKGCTRKQNAQYALAQTMKESFEEESEKLFNGTKQAVSVWNDLLGAALSEVNWDEIAEHFMGNVKEAA